MTGATAGIARPQFPAPLASTLVQTVPPPPDLPLGFDPDELTRSRREAAHLRHRLRLHQAVLYLTLAALTLVAGGLAAFVSGA